MVLVQLKIESPCSCGQALVIDGLDMEVCPDRIPSKKKVQVLYVVHRVALEREYYNVVGNVSHDGI